MENSRFWLSWVNTKDVQHILAALSANANIKHCLTPVLTTKKLFLLLLTPFLIPNLHLYHLYTAWTLE